MHNIGSTWLAREWVRTSTFKSSGGRSNQTSSDFCFVCDAGSTGSWQLSTGLHDRRDLTRHVASATRQSRDMSSTVYGSVVEVARGRCTKVTRWASQPTKVLVSWSSREVYVQLLRCVCIRGIFRSTTILFNAHFIILCGWSHAHSYNILRDGSHVRI